MSIAERSTYCRGTPHSLVVAVTQARSDSRHVNRYSWRLRKCVWTFLG